LTLIGDCSRDSEGSEGEQANSYGGVNNADSSGTLQYVVVKHTGAEVANGDELNGVTFSGVGSGTTVSFLQAYSTFDDGIEFFGGAVNVDHYVGLYVNDDSIDFDEGYRGTIEYALVIQAADDGNRCVEGDGVGSHSEMRAANAVAQNLNGQPVIENLTCILSGESTLSQGGTGTRDDPSQGLRLREGLFPVIRNALITSAYLGDRLLNDDDFNYCLRVDNGQTIASVAQNDGNVLIESSIFACQDLVDGQSGTPEGGAEVTLTEDDLLAFLANNNSQAFQTDELGQDPSADVQNGLEILDGFFSLPLADMLIDGVAPTITAFDRGTGETPFVGAVQSSNDWTAGWAYGLEEGNQGQPLYFEE